MVPATATAGVYCKQCGYDLRASQEAGRCPECGRIFSPEDPKTFRPRPFAAPWKRAVARWAKRLAILLLVLVLLLAGTWGWYYWGWKQDQAALAQMGGTEEEVVYLFAEVHHPTILGGTPGKWLHDRDFPGSEVLKRVSVVALPQTARDADLLPLRNLAELQALWVRGPITEAGLAVLRDLPHLEYLHLDTVSITDAGLGHVAQLRGLKSLALRRMPLTDLAPLAKLPALEVLILQDTQVTDAGLAHLEKLTRLKWLDLKRTKVTPAGVARLRAALPRCRIVGP